MTEAPAERLYGLPLRRGQIFAVGAFSNQLGLKVTAVFMSLVLWFVVNAKEPERAIIPVRFTPILDSSLVLREQLPQVKAYVAGAPSDLLKLNSAPPMVRREITADAPDTLVIDLRPEDVILPPGVDVVVRDIDPKSITLRFESTWSRRVPVRSAIDIATNGGTYGVAALIDPLSVEVNGPRNLVARIPFVRTIKTTIPYPDSLPHLVDLDTAALGQGVRVRPSQVRVSLTPAVRQ